MQPITSSCILTHRPSKLAQLIDQFSLLKTALFNLMNSYSKVEHCLRPAALLSLKLLFFTAGDSLAPPPWEAIMIPWPCPVADDWGSLKPMHSRQIHIFEHDCAPDFFICAILSLSLSQYWPHHQVLNLDLKLMKQSIFWQPWAYDAAYLKCCLCPFNCS